MKHLAILDYGAGNLYSIRRAFEKLDVTVSVTTDSNIIKEADGFILPGVGAFQDALPTVNQGHIS